MKALIKPIPFILLLPAILTSPNMTSAGVPDVEHVMVTDVTTVSFSVIWAASESSTATLEVFVDEDGTVPVSAAVITSHPVESGNLAIKEAAENIGVMKVRVTGLQAGTSYYFRTRTTSKSTVETAVYPEDPPMLPVQTELETVRTYTSGSDTLPFGNDVIIKECFLEDGITPAEGAILVASVKGGSYLLSAFVGDGVDPPNALIDLNNVFSREFSENLDLQSGENLTLVIFRGMNGYSIITHEVPEDLSMCEVKAPWIALRSGRNLVSVQLEPGDTNVEEVLNPIIDTASSVWAYDSTQERWIFYAKDGLPFLNELTELHAFDGFWLYMEAENSWMINGGFNDSTIPLKSGRNLVGYNRIESIPILDAVASISDQLISIWNFDSEANRWKFYVKEGLPFLNELDYIEPGRAYWVYVDSDCQW